ncbi:MAG: putative two-component system response regulator [Porticoccaceae bacterium]|jgi:putative two-component system response regulator
MITEAGNTTLDRSRAPARIFRADAVHTAIADGSIAFGADLADGDLLESALPHPGSVSAEDVLTSRIMIVDDEAVNVRVVRKLLSRLGYQNLTSTTDSTQVLELLRRQQPDVLLLDVMMPEVSGFAILKAMQSDDALRSIPVLVLTAMSDRKTRLTSLELGANDFLEKPIDQAELSPRVRNALMIKACQSQLRSYADDLRTAVRQRTRQLSRSRLEVVHCLARAAEFRDDDTGQHVIRVGHFAKLIAHHAGLPRPFVDMIGFAAQLHDVGKIGIPDSILLKPGPLTDEEFDFMRGHCDMGNRVLSASRVSDRILFGTDEVESADTSSPEDAWVSPVSGMAATIAMTHHEKWDGSGYPNGLSGEEIPLEGRITAIADVFDALSSKRPYKDAYPVDRCFEILREGRGKHFDPQLLDVFLACRPEIEQIQLENREDS